MPLPMVHLSIARQLTQLLEIEDHEAFYIGAIAPDAIHKRDDMTRKEKNITHLDIKSHISRDVAFKSVIDYYKQPTETNRSFLLGYCVHVLTDSLWLFDVFRPFKKVLIPNMGRASITHRYYTDTAYIDNQLYEEANWRGELNQLFLVRRKLSNELVFELEIHQWQEQVAHWMNNRHTSDMSLPQCIKYERIVTFINECSHEVALYLRPELN